MMLHVCMCCTCVYLCVSHVACTLPAWKFNKFYAHEQVQLLQCCKFVNLSRLCVDVSKSSYVCVCVWVYTLQGTVHKWTSWNICMCICCMCAPAASLWWFSLSAHIIFKMPPKKKKQKQKKANCENPNEPVAAVSSSSVSSEWMHTNATQTHTGI